MPDRRLVVVAAGPLVFEHWATTYRTTHRAEPPLPVDCHHLLFNHGVPRLLSGVSGRTLQTGEAIVLDEPSFQRFVPGRSLGLAHWYLPTAWLLARVDSPRRLLGYPLRGPCKWCAALNAFLAQMTLDLVDAGPVAPAALAEQIGTLLALVAEGEIQGPTPGREHGDLRERAWMRIVEQCSNAELTMAQIARSLSVSTRMLQRTLAVKGETFSNLLLEARIQLAARMLESPNLGRIAVAEIGRRVGFKDPSHFAKVFRRLRGMSPAQARNPAGKHRR